MEFPAARTYPRVRLRSGGESYPPFRGDPQMAKMETMSRVLVEHDWTSIEEWVRAVRDLADLDDQALDELERIGKCASTCRRDPG